MMYVIERPEHMYTIFGLEIQQPGTKQSTNLFSILMSIDLLHQLLRDPWKPNTPFPMAAFPSSQGP